jgi:hypothetical protein
MPTIPQAFFNVSDFIIFCTSHGLTFFGVLLSTDMSRAWTLARSIAAEVAVPFEEMPRSTAAEDFPGIDILEANVLPSASSGVDLWLLLRSNSSLAWLQLL